MTFNLSLYLTESLPFPSKKKTKTKNFQDFGLLIRPQKAFTSLCKFLKITHYVTRLTPYVQQDPQTL